MKVKQIFSLAAFPSIIYASATADETYTNTLADCQTFASKFDNTCTSTSTQVDFKDLPKKDVTCENVGTCGSTTEFSGDAKSCTWSRKLCVTCYQDSNATDVMIRVQSNGLPNHCFFQNSTRIAAQDMDYKVKWLSSVSTQAKSNVQIQGAVNGLVCNILRSNDKEIPTDAGFVKTSGDLDDMWGIAVSGVQLGNAISSEGVDPIYPAKYGVVTFPDNAKRKVDQCLGDVSNTGDYHYNIASTCIADKTTYQAKSAPFTDDIKTSVRTAYTQNLPYRSVLGVSKDGRPIYTPYFNHYDYYSDCQVDICNGISLNGHYSYVATFFHPYIMGCYGKGSKPSLYQQCSANPKLCNIEMAVEQAKFIQLGLFISTIGFLVSTDLF